MLFLFEFYSNIQSSFDLLSYGKHTIIFFHLRRVSYIQLTRKFTSATNIIQFIKNIILLYFFILIGLDDTIACKLTALVGWANKEL